MTDASAITTTLATTASSTAESLSTEELQRLTEVLNAVNDAGRVSAQVLQGELDVPSWTAQRYIERLVAEGVLMCDPEDPARFHLAPNDKGAEQAPAAAAIETREVHLVDITVDVAIQPRVGINQEVVDDYTAAYARGETLPPLELFEIEGELTLVAGFHRYKAARQADLETLSCEVRVGTTQEASMHAIASNAKHGARMTRADKRKVIGTLLRDDQWATKSNSAIARFVGVDHKTVANVRKELESEGLLGDSQDGTRTVERGGKTFTMKTAGIGTDQAATESAAPTVPFDGEDEVAEGTLLPCDGPTPAADACGDGDISGEITGPGHPDPPSMHPAGRPSNVTIKEVRAAAQAWIAALQNVAPSAKALADAMKASARQDRVRSAAHQIEGAIDLIRLASE